jgi:hypothetical protein
MNNPLEWKFTAQAGLLASTIAGTGFGIVISYQSGDGWMGTFIWALIGAVILGGAFYFDRVLRVLR